MFSVAGALSVLALSRSLSFLLYSRKWCENFIKMAKAMENSAHCVFLPTCLAYLQIAAMPRKLMNFVLPPLPPSWPSSFHQLNLIHDLRTIIREREIAKTERESEHLRGKSKLCSMKRSLNFRVQTFCSTLVNKVVNRFWGTTRQKQRPWH